MDIKLHRHPETNEIIPEEWKPVVGYEGHYKASNYGRVKSLDRTLIRSNGSKYHVRECLLKQPLSGRGYNTVNIDTKCRFVHRLVAKAFISNPENKPQINHKNGIKTDNRIENLEWVTNRENLRHAWDTGLYDNSGENCGTSKLTEDEVLQIRSIWEQGWVTQREISESYGVSQSNISSIVNRNKWQHI